MAEQPGQPTAPTVHVNIEAVPDVRRVAEILRILSRTAYEVHTTLQDAATDLDLIGSDDEPGEQPAEPDAPQRFAFSPDCKAGKCTGCTGDAWDVERDQMTPCEHACHLPPI